MQKLKLEFYRPGLKRITRFFLRVHFIYLLHYLIVFVWWQCLVFNELPFADDWRPFEFEPIVTQETQPSKEQLNAIDLLIDKLDLTEK